MKLKFFVFVVFLFSLSTRLFPQQFTHSYRLNTAKREGWYKLLLPPAMRANAKPDLSDLRLYGQGDSSKEIPYFLFEEESQTGNIYFKSFKWKKLSGQSKGRYLIEHQKPELNELVLKISNHKDAREIEILGSMDGNNWYTISDHEQLMPDVHSDGTFYWQTLTFPKVKYPFLQLHFTDSLQIIQVLDLGERVYTKSANTYSQVNQIEYTMNTLPEEKLTRIKMYSSKAQWIDQFSMRIQDPPYFLRSARLYKKYMEKRKKGPAQEIRSDLFSFELKAGSVNSFSFRHLLQDTLYLDILNLDNMPLLIRDLSFYQKPIYLYTYLKTGDAASLFLGQPELNPPNYDIRPFASNLQSVSATELKVVEMKALDQPKAVKEVRPFWQGEAFMWACIGVGAVVVFFSSYRLINEMKTEN